MPRRNLHCKYYVLKHITIQALEATQSQVDALRQIGLVLNAGKTKKKIDDAEPTPSRTCVTWRDSCGDFGTRPCAQLVGLSDKHPHGSHGHDLEHHLQAASRIFFAIKSILFDKSVSIAQRLAYFDAMVTPVACFASGHRKIYKQDLRKLDVKFRKLVRTIVGAPGGLAWSAPWHHMLHEWNARVLECAEQAGVKLWSRR